MSNGYTPKRKTYVLKFEDDEYEGLVVKARGLKLGKLLRVGQLAQLDPKNITPEDLERFEELFSTFARALVEWNLLDVDTKKPVPATLEGVTDQDADFMMPIIKAWFAAIAGVSGPLGQRSSNGGRSVEPSIPMEAK